MKQMRWKKEIIEHEIDEMEKGNLNTSSFDYKRIKSLEAELDDIHDKKKGVQIRSKLRWIEEGEKTLNIS